MDTLSDAVADVQAALAAALARIEAFRVRERQLIAEVSALRQEVHGSKSGGGAAGAQVLQIPAAAGTGHASPGAPQHSTSNDLKATSTCSLAVPIVKEPAFTAVDPEGGPMYVSSVNGQDAPVVLLQQGDKGNEKVHCQLIMDKDWIDFVQLRVRVKSDDFIGITAVKESKAKSSGSRFLCCFGGGPGAVIEVPLRAADAVLPGRQAELLEAGADGQPEDQQQQGYADPASTSSGVGATETASTRGRYRIYVRGREQRPVEFDASHVTRATLHKHTQRWLGQEDETGDEAIKEAEAEESGGSPMPRRGGTSHASVRAPRHLLPGPMSMRLLGDPSHILTPQHVAALSSAVPPLERMRDWSLAYSTKVHGISLATLYRKVHSGAIPTITLIKDNNGHIFGCYTPEGWKVAPRYYGSGESFVFQLEPYRLMWGWHSNSREKNDFFQYSTLECMALGGTGHFALHVDQELLQGSSGVCGTFGSPCLSAKEDFKVMCLEVWQVA